MPKTLQRSEKVKWKPDSVDGIMKNRTKSPPNPIKSEAIQSFSRKHGRPETPSTFWWLVEDIWRPFRGRKRSKNRIASQKNVSKLDVEAGNPIKSEAIRAPRPKSRLVEPPQHAQGPLEDVINVLEAVQGRKSIENCIAVQKM